MDCARSAVSVCFVCGKRIAKHAHRFLYRLLPGHVRAYERYVHPLCCHGLPGDRDHALASLFTLKHTAPVEFKGAFDQAEAAMNPDAAAGSGG